MKFSSLFNVNGSIGKSAYSATDFPSVSELLSHMDYLGIDRSLVWHVLSVELNPADGNKRLLKEISDSNSEDRLFPAFVITPACYYERGTIDFLRESLNCGRVKALRLNVSGFSLRQIKRVLSDLAEFEPTLFCDFPSQQVVDDLELLAAEFPGIHFVLTQVKNRSVLCSILNLMSLCPNVYVDISWLYIRGMLEMFCRHCGAERVLFGLGSKAHYGAAIAELAFARISDTERELVAHGNIERLLKISALDGESSVKSSVTLNKPLWECFRNGNALNDVEIINAHAHDCVPKSMGYLSTETFLAEYAESFVEQSRRIGIDKAIVISGMALFGDGVGGNQETEAIFVRYGGLFKGYLGFNPRCSDSLTPLFDDFFGRDFYVGFKLLSSYWKIPVTDPSYNPVWEYADKHCLPILLHTWSDPFDSPAMLSKIVKKYPNAIFLLAHAGGSNSGRVEAIELCQNNDNVYLEFCGSFTTPELFEDAIKQVGIEKIIYGSDTLGHSEVWELGRFLSLPLSDDELRPALAENIKRILEKRS